MPDNEQAAKVQIVELFRSAGGLQTIENLALALCGAPPEKIEHDIAKLSLNLRAKMAKHPEDWPSKHLYKEGKETAKDILEDEGDENR
jgi:hypothetical protein